jgi:hypothetical protein
MQNIEQSKQAENNNQANIRRFSRKIPYSAQAFKFKNIQLIHDQATEMSTNSKAFK